MWKLLSLVAVVCAATACVQAPTTDPSLVVEADSPDSWFENDPIQVEVEWPAEVDCTHDGWDCTTGSLPAFSITGATCDGCTLTGVSNETVENAQRFTVTATTSGEIHLAVAVESGGETRALTATAIGDREVGLKVDCQVVRTDLLGESELDPAWLTPCGATHAADETVILTPTIATVHGAWWFPFCPDDATCSPAYRRKTSQIVFTGATYAWDPRDFVMLSDAAAAQQVTVTAPLADGTLATVTVATPALATP